ncbi:Cobalamin biosynthesis protein CobD [Halioglobus japonicus]|nr:Cobalamin biosynthesis protein CobD [Halioglobus japonicus]
MISASLLVALAVDRLVGEVPQYHPLVGFGRVANSVEARARASMRASGDASFSDPVIAARRQRWLGLICWTVLVIPPTCLLWALLAMFGGTTAALLSIAVLYFCIGWRSLAEHANAIAAPLVSGNLQRARQQLSRIVSRDTADLDAQSVAKATVESVLENGSDAVLAPIFWFVVAGAPGVLCYRLSNTLDAMWGYRNARFLHFGRTAARMDDLLNWVPARFCALSYAAVGQWRAALRCWRTQAALCDSPNAGPVMSCGAGALGVVLGGAARYENVEHWRPVLGEGHAAQPEDIGRALRLLRRAIGVWIVVIVFCEWLL